MLRGGKTAGLFGCVLMAAGVLMLGGSESAEARPQYFKAFTDNYPDLKKEIAVQKCNVCHFGKDKKDRSNYGEAFGKTLSKVVGDPQAKNVPAKQLPKIKEAVKKTEEEKSAVADKTFGDLLKEKKLPATGWEPPKEGGE